MKTYIGDAVYADVTDQEVILTTEDGFEITNRIVLGPSEVVSLVKLLEGLVGNEEMIRGGE